MTFLYEYPQTDFFLFLINYLEKVVYNVILAILK